MAFILNQKDSYTWPVSYGTPKENGQHDSQKFTAEFKMLPQSKLDEMPEQFKKGDLDDSGVVDMVLLGWAGIKTAKGEDFEYNEVNRMILLDLPGMRAAIVKAYFESIPGATRKN